MGIEIKICMKQSSDKEGWRKLDHVGNIFDLFLL